MAIPMTIGQIQAELTTKGFKEFQTEATLVDSRMAGLSKSLNTFGDKAIKLGGTLTKSLTLPLAAAGGAMLKFAVDGQESVNAVNVVFGEAADTIFEFGQISAESAGLSTAAFQELSTKTGAALLNAGIATDEAAESTIALTTRAADLASVFNTDVNDALAAIQSGLRGEIDPLERFGVTMNAATVQAKAMEMGLADANGEISAQAMVSARLAVILEQTQRVQGDFANTSDQLANKSRILKAELINVAASLGEQLIPIAEDVVDVVSDVAEKFAALDEDQQKLILTLGAVAAASGPVIAGIGGISKAIAFLAANPIVAAVAGVAALTIGIATLIEKNKEARFEEQYQAAADKMLEINSNAESVVETITEFANQTGLTVEQSIQVAEEQGLITDEVRTQVETLKTANQAISQNGRTLKQNLEVNEMIGDAIGRGAMGMFNIADEATNSELALDAAREQVAALSDNLDVAYGTVIEIGLANENVNGYYREALETLKDQYDTQQQQARSELERVSAASRTSLINAQITAQQEQQTQLSSDEADEEERINQELEEQAKRREEIIQGRINSRLAALEKFEQAQDQAQARFDFGLIDARGLLEENLAAARQQIQDLINADYRSTEAWEETLGVQTINEMQALITQLESQLEGLDKEAEESAAQRQQAALNAEKAAQLELQRLEEKSNLERQYADLVFRLEADKLDVIERNYQEELALANKIGADTTNIRAFYEAEREAAVKEREDAEQAAAAERIAIIRDEAAQKVAIEQQWLNKIAQQAGNRAYLIEQERKEALKQENLTAKSILAINTYYDNKLADIEEEKTERLEEENEERIEIEKEYWKTVGDYAMDVYTSIAQLVEDSFDVRMDIIDSELATKIAALDKEALGEEKYQEEVEKLEREAALKKWDIERKAFNASKAFNIAQIVVNTATAIMKGFAELGPIGGAIAAVILGAIGAAQIAVVASQPPPPKPAFAEGGVVTGPMDALVGEAGPEAILPLNDNTYSALGQAISDSQQATVAETQTDDNMVLNIFIDGVAVGTINVTQDALNNGEIRVPATAIVEGM